MWHLTACKISFSLSFFELDQKWNDFLSYLWNNVGNINSEILYKKKKKEKRKSFHFKNERLTEILLAVRCHILWLY